MVKEAPFQTINTYYLGKLPLPTCLHIPKMNEWLHLFKPGAFTLVGYSVRYNGPMKAFVCK